MRDPLSWVPIKYKLPLTFLVICLVAFGVGGVVVTSTAAEALEEQILLRLDEHAAATKIVVERGLVLLGRRSEDFASDGFIRTELEAILEGRDTTEHRRRLEQHLKANKLPLVEAFVDACVAGPEGEPRAWVVESPGRVAPGGRTEFGPLRPRSGAHDYPTYVIATPLNSLDGTRRIGTLQMLVRADTWVAGLEDLASLPAAGLRGPTLVDPAGRRLRLGADGVGGGDTISYTRSIATNGWRLELGVDRAAALRPITGLRERYLAIGAALLLLTAGVLFFPVRFLLRPLGRIREAARRIAAGDFRARVAHESRDEIGDLSQAFDIMAGAVEERATKLEAAAETLRRRERDIRFERDRLDTVLRSMQDGVFVLDAEGRVTLSNAAARPLVRALEAGGCRRIDCRATADEIASCAQCLRDGAVHVPCLLEAEGKVYEVHAGSFPGPDAAVAGRLCVSRDVTERIASREQQAHQERMSVLGEIAAVMAHELNNPLGSIAMFGQMLEGQLEPGSAARESAEVIRRNADTCKQTIRGLLDMASSATTDIAEFDLRDLLDDLRVFLRPVYERAGAAFRVVARLEDPVLAGDELQLRQALVNLVMNALQAMEGRRGSLTVEAADDGDGVAIRVRDTGPGIPEEVRAHIFQPFFTTKAPGTGTGLGLPTSRRIVEAHGGTLDLEATGPEGTVFRIALPRRGARASWQARARRASGVVSRRFAEGARTPGSAPEERHG